MILGIDASNIRAGGALTHLIEFLGAATPSQSGIEHIFVWTNKVAFSRLPARTWLTIVHEPVLDWGFWGQTWWQVFRSRKRFMERRCEIVFVPGGTYLGSFRPIVSLSQNMLPFQPEEASRFGYSFRRLRYNLLRLAQLTTFRRSTGVIFLTNFARDTIQKHLSARPIPHQVIHHGISARFYMEPRPQLPISSYSKERRLRLLYVSHLESYKHQPAVCSAVARLAEEGYPIELKLVGSSGRLQRKQLTKLLDALDPKGLFIRYHGAVDFSELHRTYHEADINIFASTCENLPITLLEGMAAGLPTICSSAGPMPEILLDGGVYINPESINSIEQALRNYLSAPDVRSEKALRAYEIAKSFSWEKCAHETLTYLRENASLCMGQSA